MDWTISIVGMRVASEDNFGVDLKRNKPKEKELYIFETTQGMFIFRVEDVKNEPRKAHVILVTRVRRIDPEDLPRYRAAIRNYNQIIACKARETAARQCHNCRDVYLAIPKGTDICPNCGVID